MKNSEIGHKLSEPIAALKSGYHENAIVLCGNILQSILRDMWKKENIPGNHEALDVEKLLEGVKGKIEDRLIERYFDEITEASQKADKGEHLEIEEAFDIMRKLCSVVMWYLEKYLHGYTKHGLILRRRHIGLILFALIISVIASVFLVNSFVNRSRVSDAIDKISMQKDSMNIFTDEDWIEFGKIQILSWELNGAIYSFSKALEIKKTDTAYWLRAAVYDLKRFYEKSLADCNEAIKINPKCRRAYCIKGKFFERIGEIEKAKNNFMKSCYLDDAEACEFYERLTGKKL